MSRFQTSQKGYRPPGAPPPPHFRDNLVDSTALCYAVEKKEDTATMSKSIRTTHRELERCHLNCNRAVNAQSDFADPT